MKAYMFVELMRHQHALALLLVLLLSAVVIDFITVVIDFITVVTQPSITGA